MEKKEQYRVLEYDNRLYKERIYTICDNIGIAFKMARELNSKQQGIIPEYTYTVQVEIPVEM